MTLGGEIIDVGPHGRGHSEVGPWNTRARPVQGGPLGREMARRRRRGEEGKGGGGRRDESSGSRGGDPGGFFEIVNRGRWIFEILLVHQGRWIIFSISVLTYRGVFVESVRDISPWTRP